MEAPLPVGAYMYVIRLESYGAAMQVNLVRVVRDEEANPSKPTIPAPGLGDR